jgi:hypothetical protein
MMTAECRKTWSPSKYDVFKYVRATQLIFLSKNGFSLKKNYELLPNLVFTASDVMNWLTMIPMKILIVTCVGGVFLTH